MQFNRQKVQILPLLLLVIVLVDIAVIQFGVEWVIFKFKKILKYYLINILIQIKLFNNIIIKKDSITNENKMNIRLIKINKLIVLAPANHAHVQMVIVARAKAASTVQVANPVVVHLV